MISGEAQTQSLQERTLTRGKKRRKNRRLREDERGGAGEGRWTTTRDQNDTFFLSINLGHNEI